MGSMLTPAHIGTLPCRFYASQPIIGHIEKNVLMDDVKRREREAKERASEANMLDSLYQVCAASAAARAEGNREQH